jgi:hypothetical protein
MIVKANTDLSNRGYVLDTHEYCLRTLPEQTIQSLLVRSLTAIFLKENKSDQKSTIRDRNYS